MKKLVVLCAIAAVCAGTAFAQVSLGVNGGIGYTMVDIEGDEYYDINRISIPVLAEFGYQLPNTFEAGGLGEAVVVVGVKGGYMPLVSGKGKDIDAEFKYYTIPVLLIGRMEAGMFYFEGGLGVHAWTAEAETLGMKFDDNGIDLAVEAQVGLKFDLSEKLALRTGVGYYTTSLEEEDSDGDTNTVKASHIGANVGISFKL